MWGCACCSLSEEGAEALAAFVKHSRKLEELIIYMNDVGDAGAEKVCNLLPVWEDPLDAPYKPDRSCQTVGAVSLTAVSLTASLHSILTLPFATQLVGEARGQSLIQAAAKTRDCCASPPCCAQGQVAPAAPGVLLPACTGSKPAFVHAAGSRAEGQLFLPAPKRLHLPLASCTSPDNLFYCSIAGSSAQGQEVPKAAVLLLPALAASLHRSTRLKGNPLPCSWQQH